MRSRASQSTMIFTNETIAVGCSVWKGVIRPPLPWPLDLGRCDILSRLTFEAGPDAVVQAERGHH